jgi:uncharacterized membrane protein YesL
MTAAAPQRREAGEGVLSRGALAVYHVLVYQGLLLLTASPGIALLLTLRADASNLPLAALAAVPLGPALAATLFAWRRALQEPSLQPARHFWRGYRLNALPVLLWWVPALGVATVLGINATGAGAVPGGEVLGAIAVVLLVVLLLVVANALVITALYSLRTRDVLRLAAYYLVRSPRTTVATLALAVVIGGSLVLLTELVPILISALLALALLHGARPIRSDIEENFVS